MRPASRPLTPTWLPLLRLELTPLRDERASLVELLLRDGVVPIELLRLEPTELLLRLDDDGKLLRLLEPTVLRLGVEGLLLRLELTELLLRLDEDEELLRLGDEKLLPRLLDEELLRELLTDELLRLLEPPPPLREPPPRCAKAGVALNARAAIRRTIAFEVFISLLLSCLVLISTAKIQKKTEGFSLRLHYFSNQPTWQPALTTSEGCSRTKRPSLSSALRIMPWLSTPFNFRGGKLAMKQTCRPTSFSGSG